MNIEELIPEIIEYGSVKPVAKKYNYSDRELYRILNQQYPDRTGGTWADYFRSINWRPTGQLDLFEWEYFQLDLFDRHVTSRWADIDPLDIPKKCS